MVLCANIIVLLLSVYIFFSTWEKRRNVAFYCLVLFDSVYVFPLLVEMVLGKPFQSSSYIGFVLSSNDDETALFYALFALFVELIFFVYLKRVTNEGFKIDDIIGKLQSSLFNKPVLTFFAVFVALSPILAIALAPNPSLYVIDVGAFSVENHSVSLIDVVYHNNIVKKIALMAAIGVIVLKLTDKKNAPVYKFIRVIGIVLVALANGKRTLVSFLVITLILIDLLLKKKKKYIRFNAVVSCLFIAVYFVAYSYISGKYEYNTDWYSVVSEYFFRNNSVKVAIYSFLNPERLSILDYPGQTILFDFLFFIPRSIWPSKPFPFPDYYTSAIFGFNKVTSIGWNFQTNIYVESIANFGIIAFVLTPLYLLVICNLVNKSKNLFSYLFGLLYVLLIHVFEFSDMLKVFVVLWIFFMLKGKVRFRRRKI